MVTNGVDGRNRRIRCGGGGTESRCGDTHRDTDVSYFVRMPLEGQKEKKQYRQIWGVSERKNNKKNVVSGHLTKALYIQCHAQQ